MIVADQARDGLIEIRLELDGVAVDADEIPHQRVVRCCCGGGQDDGECRGERGGEALGGVHWEAERPAA